MKIVLQNVKTLKFIGVQEHPSEESWTPCEARARIFGNGLDAITHCYRRGVLDMQILCVFDDPRRNFSVSVTDNRLE